MNKVQIAGVSRIRKLDAPDVVQAFNPANFLRRCASALYGYWRIPSLRRPASWPASRLHPPLAKSRQRVMLKGAIEERLKRGWPWMNLSPRAHTRNGHSTRRHRRTRTPSS